MFGFGAAKCVKCDSSSFRLELIEPAGSGYKLNAVHCSNRGAAFGVTDYWNVGMLVKQQEKTIADLGRKIDSIQSSVAQIAHALQSMRR
jgi:hypothetical protein